jgi:hypothetical protein
LTTAQRNQIQVAGNPSAKGKLIYNTDTDCLEFWDGSKWVNVWLSDGNDSVKPTDYIGTNNAADFVIKTNSNEQMRITADGNVGIQTHTPKTALDVNGELTIGTVNELEPEQDIHTKALYIDTKTGLVGLHPAGMHAVAPIFYSSIEPNHRTPILPNIQDRFNNGSIIVVPVKSEDASINNLGINFVTVGSETYFQVKDDGIHQITAAMSASFRTSANNAYIFINVKIEKSSDNGASWNAIVGTRPVLNIQWHAGQNIPINLPVTIQKLQAGDLLRMVFHRTADTFGTPQGDVLTGLSVVSGYSAPAYIFSLTQL